MKFFSSYLALIGFAAEISGGHIPKYCNRDSFCAAADALQKSATVYEDFDHNH